MTTEIKYKKNILYLKINESLNKDTYYNFESEIVPIVLNLKINKLNINLSKVLNIDDIGINSLIKVSSIINGFNGEVDVRGINNSIRNILNESDLFDYCNDLSEGEVH